MKKRVLGAILFYVLLNFAFAQPPSLQFFPNFHSIGYRIALPANFDSDTNATVTVKYYSANHPLDTGFAPYRLRQDTFNEFRGSLFMLEPNTKYHVQITLTDSTPTLQTFTFYDSVMTRSEPVVQPTSNIKYVSPTGSGNAYTLTNPGNLATLINNNLVTCGTTVMLLDGVYDVSNMVLNINSDCSPQTPIVIMAAPGANPVLDGGYYQPLNWTQHQFDPDLYTATLPASCAYTTLCLLDSLRLYPYAGVDNSNTIPNNYPIQHLGYGLSGFCRNDNIIRIKTLDGKNPGQHQVILSKAQSCLRVYGNNKKCYLYIKGIQFKHYNRPFVSPTASYPSFTLEFQSCNNVFIDSCRFHYSNNPILFRGDCNFNTVQNCAITDQTGWWGHEAFKETAYPKNDSWYQAFYLNTNYRTAFGRNLENSGISFIPYQTKITGNVIRNCTVNGVVDGISAGHVSDVMVCEETDIYNNKVNHCYDGINYTNGQINTRVWNNEIGHAVVGMSLISGRYGPRYVFRNVIHHISDRANPSMDPDRILFAYCNNTSSDKIWGTGIKMNAGSTTTNPGALFLMHNTFHASDTLAFAMYLWKSDWRKLYSRNNIYYNEGLSTFFFDDVANDTKYSFNSGHDNFFNATTGTIATVQPTNGQPVCYAYNSPAQMDTGLRNVTQATDVLIKNAQNSHPQFKVIGSDFRLQCTSPMIDNGVILPGINNRSFKGAAPDIGAFEFEKVIQYTTSNHTILQTDTVSHFTVTGHFNTEYINDTLYTNVNEITHDTLTHIDCVWLPTHAVSSDSSITVTTSDTTHGCDTTFIQVNQFSYTFTTINLYDTTVCDTLATYKTTVKINVVGLKNVTEEKFAFYPNPSSGLVWITDGYENIFSVYLVGATGGVIPVTVSGNRIYLRDVPDGIYVVLINQKPAGKLVVNKKMD